jgi:inorganic pyrophosphatase/exopolyphosphatase
MMATAVKQTIGEIDVVVFTKAIDKDEALTRTTDEDRGIGQWPVGTMGTVVSDYGDHKEIEIVNELGETLDLVIVPVEQLKLVKKYS